MNINQPNQTSTKRPESSFSAQPSHLDGKESRRGRNNGVRFVPVSNVTNNNEQFLVTVEPVGAVGPVGHVGQVVKVTKATKKSPTIEIVVSNATYQ